MLEENSNTNDSDNCTYIASNVTIYKYMIVNEQLDIPMQSNYNSYEKGYESSKYSTANGGKKCTKVQG